MDLFGGLPPPKDGSATETAAPKTYFSSKIRVILLEFRDVTI